jgi:hypothetical protein
MVADAYCPNRDPSCFSDKGALSRRARLRWRRSPRAGGANKRRGRAEDCGVRLGTGRATEALYRRPYITTVQRGRSPPPHLWRWSDSSGVTPWSLGTPGLFSLSLPLLYMREVARPMHGYATTVPTGLVPDL